MATVSFPSRCAVAVICGEHLVSQVYPASVPVEVFIDSAVELLTEDLKRRGVDALDSDIGYELHRANGTRLDIAKTAKDDLARRYPVEDPARVGLQSFEDGVESIRQIRHHVVMIGRVAMASVKRRSASPDQHCIGYQFL
jgi:hypothetical protein